MGRIKYKEAIGLEVKRGRPLKGKAPNKEELARLYNEEGNTAEEIGRRERTAAESVGKQ